MNIRICIKTEEEYYIVNDWLKENNPKGGLSLTYKEFDSGEEKQIVLTDESVGHCRMCEAFGEYNACTLSCNYIYSTIYSFDEFCKEYISSIESNIESGQTVSFGILII